MVKLQKGNMPPNYGVTSSNSSSTYKPKDSFNNLYNRYAEVDIKRMFNPYRFRNNVEPYMGGIPIMFMTTPQMNIFQDSTDPGYTNGQAFVSMLTGFGLESKASQIVKGDVGLGPLGIDSHYTTGNYDTIQENLDSGSSLFAYYLQTDPELVRSLTYGESVGGTSSPWIKFLTNLFKGLGLKDLSMRTSENYESYLGWKQILPGPNIDSYTADNSLTVTYDETKNLDIIKFHSLWMEYIEAVRFGDHSPSTQMRMRRTIDYTSSIYYFILDFDMSKILYWVKYTGVYPVLVPHSSLSPGDITSKGPIDISITYAYQFKEELRPTVIYDFNSVAKFAHKVVGYSRASFLHDNVDNTFNTDRSEYGWGDLSIASDGMFRGNPLSPDPNRRSFNSVEIKILSNKKYDTRNKTGFASDTNQSRFSFHLVFNNERDSGYTLYENPTLNNKKFLGLEMPDFGIAAQDIFGKSNLKDYEGAKGLYGIIGNGYNNPEETSKNAAIGGGVGLAAGLTAVGTAAATTGIGLPASAITLAAAGTIGAATGAYNSSNVEADDTKKIAETWAKAQEDAANKKANERPTTNNINQSTLGDNNSIDNSGYY